MIGLNMLAEPQWALIFGAAKKRGARWPTNADVLAFKREVEDALAPEPTPEPPPKPTPQEIPDDYWPMLAKIESGNRPYVKAKTSSASGLYQFIRATWKGEGGKWGGNMALAFGGLKPSAEEQLERARSFTAKNADCLRKAGLPINKASLYACHFLGAGTAVRLMASDIKARADLIAGAAATKANPSILRGKSVAEFLSWLHKKTGGWAR